jgi:hypothetical protein
MPNSTVPYIRSMTPDRIDNVELDIHTIDEYVRTDLSYLDLFQKGDRPTLIAFVGVQSHQFHRSLDLAAFARSRGVEHCVIGGPHPMTCDTSSLQNRGVSFALAEAESIWSSILRDAISGRLRPVYGADRRWQDNLDAPVLMPPSRRDLRRYVIPMLGVYPARGCPYTCNFCSVIKIAGRQIRSQDIETTIQSLRAAKKTGVKMVMFTSDNFNKYSEARELLQRMIAEKIDMPFFVQCDTQVAKQEDLFELLGQAGCFQMFVGVESFSRQVLLAAKKTQNHPSTYGEIVRLCRKYSIASHFSNIIGFPEDTVQSIRGHVDVLRGLAPDVASIYILTPIPGTQQYDEFLKAGRIDEPNLDRFDAQTVTWRHDNIGSAELESLLFECYKAFYSARHILSTSLRLRSAKMGLLPGFGLSVFTRFAAARKTHPMSGGIGRVYRDSALDYRDLRSKVFDIDLAPLPQSLALSEGDAELNRRVKIVQ